MDDDGWKQWRTEQQARRKARLPERTAAILALQWEGYEVEWKSEYHFRVNGRMDLWPIHNRWHDLRTQERGGAPDLADFIRARFRPEEPT